MNEYDMNEYVCDRNSVAAAFVTLTFLQNRFYHTWYDMSVPYFTWVFYLYGFVLVYRRSCRIYRSWYQVQQQYSYRIRLQVYGR